MAKSQKDVATCRVLHCENEVYGWGMCERHHLRRIPEREISRRKRRRPKGTIQAYVYDVVLPFSDSDCLIWPFSRTRRGYAQGSVDGQVRNLPRYVCILANGEPSSPDLEAAHQCGKGHLGCVNPRHLVWKTHAENMADKEVHGTLPRGESHPLAKVKTADVIEIRNQEGVLSSRQLADRFGISTGHVRLIQTRTIWRHVD